MTTKLNTTQRRMIQRGALLAAQAAEIEKELKALKATLSEALGDGTFTAGNAELNIKTSERTTLDAAIVKGFLTPAQVIAASKTADVTVLKFKLKAVVEAVKAA